MPKLIRITTVPMALRYLLPGQMHFMKEQGFDVLMISADGKERADVVVAENCPHIIVPMTRRITPVRDLACLWQLIRIFRKEKPDIVHTHTPKAGLLGMLAARIAGVKIRIHTVAGLPLEAARGTKYQVLKQAEKMTCFSANHIWPNSYSLLDLIKEYKLCAGRKLRVIGRGSSNGIDLNRFNRENLFSETVESVKAGVSYSKENIYLLYIGRLVADKGIVELVNSFTDLQNKDKRLRLILAGDFETSLDPLPEKTLSEIKNNPSVIHIPWTNKPEYYMAISDYFIFPSHREGFPNVLLQAGAMGLPVVCSRITGNIDIITHDQTGLIFESRNESSLREILQTAVDDRDKMIRMADALKQIIKLNYSRESVWSAILSQYQLIMHEKRQR